MKLNVFFLTVATSGQARSRKFAMGGAVLGVWGRSPQLLEAGSLGAKPPAARGTGVWGRSPQRSKILHFFATILAFYTSDQIWLFIFGIFWSFHWFVTLIFDKLTPPRIYVSKDALNHFLVNSNVKNSQRRAKSVVFFLFCILVDWSMGGL